MARQILPIAGQIIGGMIGGPVGSAIGGAIGGAVGAYVDPIRHQGPKLGEARAQTAQEGVYRPLVFGTGCVAGNVIHRSPRKVVRHRESVGKGSRDTVDSDRGYRTFAIRIAEAHTPEGYTLLRIWENETLVYDVRPESEIPQESTEYAEKFRFYPGTQGQLPDPDLEAYLGVGNVNSYRGSCYIVFGNFDLTDYGDMVPQYRFEVAENASVRDVDALMIVNRSLVIQNLIPSPDGYDWSAEPISPTPGYGGGSFICAGPDRYVVHRLASGVGGISMTLDQGATWTMSVGPVLTSRGPADYLHGVGFYFPADNGIAFSADGTSHSIIPGPSIRMVACGGGMVVGWAASGHLVNLSGGINVGPAIPISFSSGGAMCYADGAFLLCGMVGSNSPGLASTSDGSSYAVIPLPSVGVMSSATSIASGQIGSGEHVTLIGTTSGHVFIKRGSNPWEVAAWSTYGNCLSITFVGTGFVLTSIGASTFQGRIQFTTDGTTAIDRPTSDVGEFLDAAAYPVADIVSADRVPLSSIIEWCHRRVGMPASSVDVSELDDPIDGVVFADGYTARDAITTLLPIYNADASEHDRGSGYRINYIKRGAPVVRTLTIDDLVDEPEETVREDPMERPRVLHMAFESPATGYTAGKASIQRLSPDVKLVNEVSTYVPVTFKDVDEAWQRADVQMRVAWTEVHGERKFSVSDAHMDLVPTDNVALALRGKVQRLRLGKGEYADGVIKLESVADRQSNYTSNVTGIPLPAPEKPPPSLMGPAALAILDIPAISDQHDRLGYYVAVTGTADAFAGAVVQRQQNGAWADVVSIGRSQRATMGVLENTVTAGSQHYTDTTNTVSVTLHMDAELESLSNTQWLNKGGAFALETATGWEIVQYRDAYQDSGGVWHLSHLARGRLNTVPDDHIPGARFVMLSGAQFIDADVGMIDQPLTLRAAAVGRSPETAVPDTITYQGNSQREFPVANLAAELDGSTLEMSAIPRDRFGTEQHPVRSANHDGFRWAATDGSATVTADSDHATASLDVSGLSAPITATVAQLNRFTGVGPTVSEQAK